MVPGSNHRHYLQEFIWTLAIMLPFGLPLMTIFVVVVFILRGGK